MNKLIVRVEEGSLYYESHEGDWLSDKLKQYLLSAFDEELLGLRLDPDADTAISESWMHPDRVYLITINEPYLEPYFRSDAGHWGKSGYVIPEINLMWNGPVEVQEPTE